MSPFRGYKPVHETFPRKIVDVHWPTEEEFFFVEFAAAMEQISAGDGAAPFCADPDHPMEWAGLFTPGTVSCDWHWGPFVLRSKSSTEMVVSGVPTATSGHSSDHYFASLWFDRWDAQNKTVTGESGSCSVWAQSIGEVGCYGTPNNGMFGQPPSKYSGSHPGPLPGPDGDNINVLSVISYDVVGETTVHASISATMDGKPLKRDRTTIFFSKVFSGIGGVQVAVRFSRPAG